MSFAQEFISKLSHDLSDEELKKLYTELEVFCADYDIRKRETQIATIDCFPDFYKVFFISKKIKGCSDGTLEQYKLQLDYFFETVSKPVKEISSEDVMLYLYLLQTKGKQGQKPMSANVADGVRRVLNSFFTWAVTNGYLERNPVSSIDKIKGEKKPRSPLTEMEIEKVRYSIDNAKRGCKGYKRNLDVRNMAIFEFLFSTGARVSEMVAVNKNDINLETREVQLYGKGKKYRTSYLNAKAVIYIKEYLKTRTDDNEALFVNYRSPHERMTKSGVRYVLRVDGDTAGVGRIFPHRIRHTTATIALNHGMRLEEVQKLLGHEKPETTLIYAKLLQENVKNAHMKCVV